MTKNSHLIIDEARAIGLDVEIINERKHLFRISDRKKSLLVSELFSMALNPYEEIYRFSKDKDITYSLWKQAGVPHPDYLFFKDFDAISSLIDSLEITFPVIAKEAGGSKSKNVHMNILDKEMLLRAVTSYSKGFIVQQMVTGKEHRLLLFKGRLLGALEMIPPSITGDGMASIIDLIERKNQSIENKVVVHDILLETLRSQDLTLDSIPAAGQTVLLQRNSRLSEGGSTEDKTDAVHPDFVKLAWKAVSSTNLMLGGVDVICADISLPPDQQEVSFLEVNTYPDLRIHYAPTQGQSRPVIRMILQEYFSERVS